MTNNSQKFFLYARKSTDVEDKQVLSIEAQIVELRAFAKQNNFWIVETFIEKQSAKIPGRPIFGEMLKRLESGEANGILAWHPDRLARNSVDGGQIIYLLDCGRITALKFPQFWFEPTPQGKFMLQIAFGQSKYYVDSLSENTKRGLRQKVRRGEYPGLAPIGYLNDVRTKTIVVDGKRSKIVRQAFELYAKGNITLGRIADFLAKNGIKTRNGNPYKRDKISFILSNPFYYGHFRYSGEIHEGKHEPIIAKKLFDKVQEVSKQRSKPQRKEKVPKSFTGLFHCGECGMMITAEIQKGHVYYRCTKKSKTKICNQPYAREEDLNQQLSLMIQKVSLRQDWAAEMSKMLERDKEQSAQSCFAFAQQNREKIKELKQKLQFLIDSYLDQIIEREIYLNKKSEIMGKIKTLEEQNIRFEQKQNDWLEPLKEFIKEAADAAKIARAKNNCKDLAIFAKKVGSNYFLNNKRLEFSLSEASAALAARAGADSAYPSDLLLCAIYSKIRTYFQNNS